MEKKIEKVLSTAFFKALKTVFKRLFQKSKPQTLPPSADVEKTQDDSKSHPWRLCPIGKHWVDEHPMAVPANWRREGYMTNRRGHCRQNQGTAEVYTADELNEIANQYFHELQSDPSAMPVPHDIGFKNGNDFDDLIAGWTKFWNEILKPEDPLTPDLVKALIATESSFILPKDRMSKDGLARGLIQITENTRKILRDPKGELKNHLIDMTPAESRRADVNIAAGIRWLHHKKNLLASRLKRNVTWEEAIAEYKGIYRQLGKVKRADDIMLSLRDKHRKLKEKRK